MKLNWFSPLPPARTDIANYTIRILPTLQESFDEVILWTDQSQWDPEIGKECEIRFYQTGHMSWPELNLNSVAIYNIGNNPLFHHNIWQISRHHPGIIVLHDFRLHDFFSEIYRVIRNNREAYLEKLGYFYPHSGRRAGKDFLDGKLSIEHMNKNYPLTNLALENALGIITHSRKNLRKLKHDNRWPCCHLPLPYSTSQPDKKTRIIKYPCRLIVFGFLGKNRRLDQIFEALATFDRQSAFRLDIYGEVSGKEDILERIKSFGLERVIKLHGFVPETQLDEALSKANLAFNLRYPDMGEASGSQLRIWAHSLPSLVTRIGWYADIPEEAVGFVRNDHEIEDIQGHLSAFLDNPVPYAAMGAQGRKILETYHNPAVYVDELVEFVKCSHTFHHFATVQYLSSKVAMEMGFCADQNLLKDASRNAAQKIYEMTFENQTASR
jgi:glycosyltransferase involved in cell wall biosynthesis